MSISEFELSRRLSVIPAVEPNGAGVRAAKGQHGPLKGERANEKLGALG